MSDTTAVAPGPAGERGAGAAAHDEPALLEVRGATRHFTVRTGPGRTGTLHAVDDVTLTLRRGMIIGLVGESGSGKTTIARLVALFYPLTSGSIELEGRAAPPDKGRRADPYRDQVQLMFQDPFGSLNVVHTIGYTLGRVLTLHGFRGGRKKLRERMIALLQQVRLEPAEDYLDKYPYQMSGGQRQRVVLARALAVDPKIILADEPVSMLDVSIRAEMLNLFADLRDRTGLSLLYVTHDMAGARYLCDRIVVMYAGQVVEQGSAEDVVVRPSHPYTRLLIESSPDPTRAERESREERFGSSSDLGEPPNVIDPQPGCRFAARCPYADTTCRTVDPPEIEVAPGQTSRCWLHDPSRRTRIPDWVAATADAGTGISPSTGPSTGTGLSPGTGSSPGSHPSSHLTSHPVEGQQS